MSTKCERFEVLDSGRGICAIFIVIFHFISMIDSPLESSSFIRNAYLFVDFFFVLSGFVLCHRYRGTICTEGDFGCFIIRRLGRIWPLHVVVLLLMLVTVASISLFPHPHDLSLTWDSNSYALHALLPSFLLLNAMGLQGSVWNGPAWSIGAEFYTYLLFALMVLFVGRRMIAACLVLSIVCLTLIYRWAPDLMNSTWDYGIIRCIAGFFGGVIAYHCYERAEPMTLLMATIGEVAAIALVFAFVTYAGQGPDSVSAISLAAPMVFGVSVVIFAGENGLLSLLLCARPFRALGRYSFSIYMTHQPLLVMLCYAFWLAGYQSKAFDSAAESPGVGSAELVMIDFVLLVILLAAASYRFIEMPARRRFNGLAEGALARRSAGCSSEPDAAPEDDAAVT